jgi:hypothetical protein
MSSRAQYTLPRAWELPKCSGLGGLGALKKSSLNPLTRIGEIEYYHSRRCGLARSQVANREWSPFGVHLFLRLL